MRWWIRCEKSKVNEVAYNHLRGENLVEVSALGAERRNRKEGPRDRVDAQPQKAW
jgi:hypothetical protein